jgi:hypothetical protein
MATHQHTRQSANTCQQASGEGKRECESCTIAAHAGVLLTQAATSSRTTLRLRRLLARRAAANRATLLTQAPRLRF